MGNYSHKIASGSLAAHVTEDMIGRLPKIGPALNGKLIRNPGFANEEAALNDAVNTKFFAHGLARTWTNEVIPLQQLLARCIRKQLKRFYKKQTSAQLVLYNELSDQKKRYIAVFLMRGILAQMVSKASYHEIYEPFVENKGYSLERAVDQGMLLYKLENEIENDGVVIDLDKVRPTATYLVAARLQAFMLQRIKYIDIRVILPDLYQAVNERQPKLNFNQQENKSEKCE